MSNQTGRTTVPAAEEILYKYFPKLDKGFIALVDYMGSDQAIDDSARVSYGAGTRAKTQQRGLLRYLRRHMHTTPSEMVELKFHVSMPIFVARQWVRHRTASLNEYSGRYSLMPMMFYTPAHGDMATQSETNHQGRSGYVLDDGDYSEAVGRLDGQRMVAVDNYKWMNEHEVARELARIDLPLSTYTQWYWKIDLHNLLHFLTLRCDSHAQWEIRTYANDMAGMVKRVAPLSYEAWVDYQLMGTKLSRQELFILQHLLIGENNDLTTTGRTTVVSEDMRKAGMSTREIDELVKKFAAPPDVPNFDLDLSRAKEPEHFEKQWNDAAKL